VRRSERARSEETAAGETAWSAMRAAGDGEGVGGSSSGQAKPKPPPREEEEDGVWIRSRAYQREEWAGFLSGLSHSHLGRAI
jgi:hypothetical protein